MKRALSIRQPWAWLIVNGHKPIENRSWSTQIRGPILIHAGNGMTLDEYEDARSLAASLGITIPAQDDLERGGIVGQANITDCVSDSDDPWFFGKYGLTMTDAKPLPFIKFKGQLKFFGVPDSVLAVLHQPGESGPTSTDPIQQLDPACGYSSGDWECRPGGYLYDAGSGEGYSLDNCDHICPHCRTQDFLEAAKEDAESCSHYSNNGVEGTGFDIWRSAERVALEANRPMAIKVLSELGQVKALDDDSVVICNTRKVAE